MNRTEGPGGRQKKVTDNSKGVGKRGSGLHTDGPVGNKSGYSDRRGSAGGIFGSENYGGGNYGAGRRNDGPDERSYRIGRSAYSGSRRNRGLAVPAFVMVLVFLLAGRLSPGNNTADSGNNSARGETAYTDGQGNGSARSAENPAADGSFGGRNTGILNTEVADAARDKRTVIYGNGEDIVTVMVYMCGTDLESGNGMATSDLQEMMAAQIGDHVNLLVYTGGCSSWRNQVVSSKTNQIYQVKDGGLNCLVEDAGDVSMTEPETLSGYIQWCAQNFPANRYELIFWDHGGGSVSGYGYDEKHPRSGSMNLAGIQQALKAGGVVFDFIGFDACLMATMETALMLDAYGDYMIASEETEPAVGWYYTGWLTALSKNPSMPTLELGKLIVDDFVNTCVSKGQGQEVSLSVTDLAELEMTGPGALAAFSKATGELIRNENYQVVSSARSGTKEFARSTEIDQVDLVHLAKNMGISEGDELAKVIGSAVKYNLTAGSMTNAYGLSIYFPYKKVSSVDSMVKTYEQIGMDSEYSRCIQDFASLEVSGQIAAGGSGSPLQALLGNPEDGSLMDADTLNRLLETFLSGGFGSIVGLDSSNTGFLSGRALEEVTGYVVDNRIDAGRIVWTRGDDGRQRLCMTDEQWNLIQNLELNLFYDDGEGFIDLGLDNVYEFDGEGNLLGENDRTWIAVNGQPVAYYVLEEDEKAGMIIGRTPAMLNGRRVNLILIFDEENPYGYIAGAQTDYDEEVTQTVARGLTELAVGDRLDFLCDYYSYDGEFQDSYYLGETMTVEEEMVISNVDVGDKEVRATYRLTDIYNRHYWTPPME